MFPENPSKSASCWRWRLAGTPIGNTRETLGSQPQLAWTLPEGFVAGPIQWPLPHRVLEPGDIEVYAYKDRVLLLTAIVAPAKIPENTVTLQAKVDWLVCAEICIPGSANLELSLPVADQSARANAELFDEFRGILPAATAPPYSLKWTKSGTSLDLTVSGLDGAKSVDLYPLPPKGEQVAHPKNGPIQRRKINDCTWRVRRVSGGLGGRNRRALAKAGWSRRLSKQPVGAGAPAQVSAAEPNATGLWQALLFGFLGGLILNLMPCVLPVISLKIFGFIRQAGDHPERILRHGLAFVGGIFAWFLGLGIVIVALKLAGSEVTWAFQFQNPWFNFVISCIVLVFALNLFGVFEIVLPGRASTALADASSQEGYAGSFFQGIFATLLATPCTAPFLGTALGFAFSQSWIVILAMFASVAFGMSAPYFFLSARPGWLKLLPKPGAWMERVKQFMGFPLLATLLWLLYILGNQRGLTAVLGTCAFLLCLALACWIYGAFCGPLSSQRARLVSLAIIALLVLFGARTFLPGIFAGSSTPETAKRSGEGIDWKPFSTSALERVAKCRRRCLRRLHSRLVHLVQIQRAHRDQCPCGARSVRQRWCRPHEG